MSGRERLIHRVIAHVRALLPRDWLGRAGEEFRAGLREVSEFAARHRLLPEDVLEDGIELGRRKIEGLASVEHATSEKNYADAAKAFAEIEDKKIDIELKRRASQSDLRRKHAEADKAEADAMLSKVQAVDALFELKRKLAAAGIDLIQDSEGNLKMLSSAEVDQKTHSQNA